MEYRNRPRCGRFSEFKLWIPTPPQLERAAPLVMVLHGCGHDAKDMAEISGMNQLADLNGFLVVYPEQSRFANLLKCWNWFDPRHQTRGAGEPSILAAVVDQVRATHPVDPDRIFLVGVSAGAAMASILAATYPDIFCRPRYFCGRGVQSGGQRLRRVRRHETRRPRSASARSPCF